MARFTKSSDEAAGESTAGEPTVSEASVPEQRPSTEEIAARAHEIYLERGAEHGNDVEDWLQAERELTEKYAATRGLAKAKTA